MKILRFCWKIQRISSYILYCIWLKMAQHRLVSICNISSVLIFPHYYSLVLTMDGQIHDKEQQLQLPSSRGPRPRKRVAFVSIRLRHWRFTTVTTRPRCVSYRLLAWGGRTKWKTLFLYQAFNSGRNLLKVKRIRFGRMIGLNWAWEI